MFEQFKLKWTNRGPASTPSGKITLNALSCSVTIRKYVCSRFFFFFFCALCFRLLLQYFCDEMNNDEVQSLTFLAGTYVAKNKLQDVQTAQSLFVILEKAQVGS